MKELTHYTFEKITECEMCGATSQSGAHTVLGQRINCSIGHQARKREGISVTVKKCKQCGLIFSSPMPVPVNIQDHYGVAPKDYWINNIQEWRESYFKYEIEKTKKLIGFKNGMRALDIGAGLGNCMISLEKAGFDCYGIEPSKEFYARSLKNTAQREDHLLNCTIEDAVFPEKYFDFITFGAVFEHLYHPASVLEKVCLWLKPGGVIHIEVPSADYLVSKIFNTYYFLQGTNYVTHLSPMHSPYHLYEFTLKSFEQLGKKLNYRISAHDYFTGPVPHLPGLLAQILSAYMRLNEKGMQLSVWLQKNQE